MNSLIFLILVIMALYTLRFFYADMLAFINTRHSFGEGFTSSVKEGLIPMGKVAVAWSGLNNMNSCSDYTKNVGPYKNSSGQYLASACQTGFEKGSGQKTKVVNNSLSSDVCDGLFPGNKSVDFWKRIACSTGVQLRNVKDNNKCKDKGGLLSSDQCKTFAAAFGYNTADKNKYDNTGAQMYGLYDGCNQAKNKSKVWYSSVSAWARDSTYQPGNKGGDASWEPVCKTDFPFKLHDKHSIQFAGNDRGANDKSKKGISSLYEEMMKAKDDPNVFAIEYNGAQQWIIIRTKNQNGSIPSYQLTSNGDWKTYEKLDTRTFKLQNRGGSETDDSKRLCLVADSNNNTTSQTECNVKPAEQFKGQNNFTNIGTRGKVVLKNENTGMCIVEEGNRYKQTECNSDDSAQQFEKVDVGNWNLLKNVRTKQCMVARDGREKSIIKRMGSEAMFPYTCNSGFTDQHWREIDASTLQPLEKEVKESKPIFKGTWQEEDTAMYPGKGFRSSETSSHHTGSFQPKTIKPGGVGTYEECKESCSKRPHCLGFEWNNFDPKGSCYMMDNWEHNGQSFRLNNNKPFSSYYGEGRPNFRPRCIPDDERLCVKPGTENYHWKGGLKVYDLYYKDIVRLNNNYENVAKNRAGFLDIHGGGTLNDGKKGFGLFTTTWEKRPALKNRAFQILSATGQIGVIKNNDEVYIASVATDGRPINHGYLCCRKDLGLTECGRGGKGRAYQAAVMEGPPNENCKWKIRLVADSNPQNIKTNSTVIFISTCDRRFMLQTCNSKFHGYDVSVGADNAPNTSGRNPEHQWKISTV